jgi:hypothetical protein
MRHLGSELFLILDFHHCSSSRFEFDFRFGFKWLEVRSHVSLYLYSSFLYVFGELVLRIHFTDSASRTLAGMPSVVESGDLRTKRVLTIPIIHKVFLGYFKRFSSPYKLRRSLLEQCLNNPLMWWAWQGFDVPHNLFQLFFFHCLPSLTLRPRYNWHCLRRELTHLILTIRFT